MIIHLFKSEKFTDEFITFLKDTNLYESNRIIVFGLGVQNRFYKSGESQQIIVFDKVNTKNIIVMLKELYLSKRIILHGLFSKYIIFLLFFQPWLLLKCNWVIWGADLYPFNISTKTLVNKAFIIVRSFVLRIIPYYLTYIEGDFLIAKNKYNRSAKLMKCNMYTSNVFTSNTNSNKKKNIFILVGNSADPANNHFQILKKLEEFKFK